MGPVGPFATHTSSVNVHPCRGWDDSMSCMQGSCEKVLKGHMRAVTCAAFLSEGDRVAPAQEEQHIRVLLNCPLMIFLSFSLYLLFSFFVLSLSLYLSFSLPGCPLHVDLGTSQRGGGYGTGGMRRARKQVTQMIHVPFLTLHLKIPAPMKIELALPPPSLKKPRPLP